jgi:hypothetical protein
MRWKPSSEQISLAVDCQLAGVNLGSAAALLGISPRTLRAFQLRLQRARVQKAISSGTGGPPAAEMPVTVNSGIAGRSRPSWGSSA